MPRTSERKACTQPARQAQRAGRWTPASCRSLQQSFGIPMFADNPCCKRFGYSLCCAPGMSTSVARPLRSKKICSCVRPGVFEVRASALRPACIMSNHDAWGCIHPCLDCTPRQRWHHGMNQPCSGCHSSSALDQVCYRPLQHVCASAAAAAASAAAAGGDLLVRGSPKSYTFWPGRCMNSPYSCAFGSSTCTRFSTSGRRVTMPVPRGRKSLPTTASRTEDLPELCEVALSTRSWGREHKERGRCVAPAVFGPNWRCSCLRAIVKGVYPQPDFPQGDLAAPGRPPDRRAAAPCTVGRWPASPRRALAQTESCVCKSTIVTHLASHNHDAAELVHQDAVPGRVSKLRANLLQLVDQTDNPREALGLLSVAVCHCDRSEPKARGATADSLWRCVYVWRQMCKSVIHEAGLKKMCRRRTASPGEQRCDAVMHSCAAARLRPAARASHAVLVTPWSWLGLTAPHGSGMAGQLQHT